jgi:hypothetical protein
MTVDLPSCDFLAFPIFIFGMVCLWWEMRSEMKITVHVWIFSCVRMCTCTHIHSLTHLLMYLHYLNCTDNAAIVRLKFQIGLQRWKTWVLMWAAILLRKISESLSKLQTKRVYISMNWSSIKTIVWWKMLKVIFQRKWLNGNGCRIQAKQWYIIWTLLDMKQLDISGTRRKYVTNIQN